MSHTCHECGQQCYCECYYDGDVAGERPDTDCFHECDPNDFLDAADRCCPCEECVAAATGDISDGTPEEES